MTVTLNDDPTTPIATPATDKRPAPVGKRRLTPVRIVGLVLLLGVLIAAVVTTKRVSTDERDAVAGEQFDAVTYVEQRWESEVRPAIIENANDVVTVLEALAADPVAAATEYGHAPGANQAAGFAVTGTAVVDEVDPPVLKVTIEGAPDDVPIYIQVGPAINGTALRDASGLVTFGEFLNQIEYQGVGNQFNEQVKLDPLADLDLSDITGKTVEFTGAFLQNRAGMVSIVPVELEVVG